MDKQQTNCSSETLVSFRLPGDVAATTVSVVGEFNDWAADAHRMRRDDEGFAVVIPLAPGRAYRFRYLLDGERWMNDGPPTPTCPTSSGGRMPSSISPTGPSWTLLPPARPMRLVPHPSRAGPTGAGSPPADERGPASGLREARSLRPPDRLLCGRRGHGPLR